jgi:hypothetical protein
MIHFTDMKIILLNAMALLSLVLALHYQRHWINRSGIQMQQQGLLEGWENLGLTGRSHGQADTSNGRIQPGDLITTSSAPGRAMCVSDHAKAEGAIIGKAMTALNEGQGMVLVLVTLQ